MKYPQFNTKAELFKYLKENKSLLITEKKSSLKKADSISYSVPVFNAKGDVIKSAPNVLDGQVDLEEIKVSVVINTTNILDSHGDVHMKGIWNKSLKEQKNLYLLQEHNMDFEHVITDSLIASAKSYTWTELGFPEFKGNTEALIFDANVLSDRNEFMFEQYVKGYVKNHSVGMMYVNLYLCINSDEKFYREEKDNWDKYIKEVVNQQDAIDLGYFWAVTEAKVIEGSAVLRGSNYATPTLSVTTTQNIEAEPITSSSKTEPPKGTQPINHQYLINQFKNK